jgi:glycosyltransferase involved in cell wall biosynthesis
MAARQRLAVVVIVKNEERQIARCLESAAWADELLIVDDDSTDRTVEIAQRYGARVIAHRSEGNFDRQRNIGIGAATADWVLQMDADEVIPPPLRQAIERALSGASDGAEAPVAYRIRRSNYFLGRRMRFGGWSTEGVKLFRREKARYIGRSVHETLQVDGPIGSLTADMEHYPFISLEQVIERTNRYTTVEARILAEEQPRLPRRTIAYQLLWRPVKIFWKSYVKRAGWRDGMHGLVFGLWGSWAHWLRWAKYWELTRDTRHET